MTKIIILVDHESFNLSNENKIMQGLNYKVSPMNNTIYTIESGDQNSLIYFVTLVFSPQNT